MVSCIRPHPCRFPLVLWILCATLWSAVASAEAPRTVMWKDLVPASQIESPFAKLSKAQLRQLSDVAEARDRVAAGEKLNAIERQDERAATRKLEEAGIDVDGLLRIRQEMMEPKSSVNRAVNTALDGKLVRIPGYVLPLEFKGKEVIEFLLVPWVGACIHTPPPPANQILHVKPDKPFTTSGLFAPVWVTGRLKTTALQKSLHLIDGTSDIDVSYALSATAVEPYVEDKK